MLIDAHHHFWKYNTGEYGWIDEKMIILRKDFLPSDLKIAIDHAGIDGVISVQARQSTEETAWLLELASENPFILGVVGWLPLTSDILQHELEKFDGKVKLVALRHVIQGEPDDNFILRADFNKGISLLKNYNLAFDILIYERQLPQTIRFVDRHPNQLFVLDHIAKPLIAKQEMSPWKENILELAKRENVYCKISGMVTEADYSNWCEDQLLPYFDVVLNSFKPDRLIFGSDWPVCTLGIGYKQWADLVRKNISTLSSDEQASIMGKNACNAYNLIR